MNGVGDPRSITSQVQVGRAAPHSSGHAPAHVGIQLNARAAWASGSMPAPGGTGRCSTGGPPDSEMFMFSTPTRARSLGLLVLAASALWLSSCAVPSASADGALARATQAMGSDRVMTLRYVAEGTGNTLGQAYKPGGAWPMVTLHSITRSIDYGSGSMRDEVVLSRAEPLP